MHQEQQQILRYSLLTRIGMRLWKLVRRYPVDPSELILSVMLSGYGLMLLSPLDTFSSSKSFDAAKRLLSEPHTGGVFFVVGLVWLYGVLLEHRWPRLICSVLAVGLLAFWTAMIGGSNPAGGGWLVYGVLTLTAFWTCVRQFGRL